MTSWDTEHSIFVSNQTHSDNRKTLYIPLLHSNETITSITLLKLEKVCDYTKVVALGIKCMCYIFIDMQ